MSPLQTMLIKWQYPPINNKPSLMQAGPPDVTATGYVPKDLATHNEAVDLVDLCNQTGHTVLGNRTIDAIVAGGK